MSQFWYTVLDDDGNRCAGTVEAPDRESALSMLAEKYTMVVGLECSDGPDRIRQLQRRLGLQSVGGVQLMAFTREMATLVKAGIPLSRALHLLMQDREDNYLREVIVNLSAGLNRGEPLSECLAEYPKVFGAFYRSLVEAGETNGDIAGALDRVCGHIEQSEKLRRTVKAALTYPVVVLGAALLVVWILTVFAVPRLEGFYGEIGQDLPVATSTFLEVGKVVSQFWWLELAAMIGLVHGARRFFGSERGALIRDRFLLSTPLISPLVVSLLTARFARTMATLTSSGVSLLRAIELCANSSDNRVLKSSLEETSELVRRGLPVSEGLRQGAPIPSMALGMLAAGEQSGSVGEMFEMIAEFHEFDATTRLAQLMGLLEPATMILVGLIMGGLIVVLGLPFVNLAASV